MRRNYRNLRLRPPASNCLGHAKPTRCVRAMSVPSGQRLVKASEPRIEYDSRRNKYHLRLLYTPKKQKTQVQRSPFYTTREEAKNQLSALVRLRVQKHRCAPCTTVDISLQYRGASLLVLSYTNAACASRYNVLVQVLLQNPFLVNCCIDYIFVHFYPRQRQFRIFVMLRFFNLDFKFDTLERTRRGNQRLTSFFLFVRRLTSDFLL